jgi:hypothetical protein
MMDAIIVGKSRLSFASRLSLTEHGLENVLV